MIDAASGTPLANSKVFAEPANPSKAAVLRSTNEQGAFCFDRLEDGQYELIAQRSGYLPTVHGARPGGQKGLPLKVEAHAELPPVAFKLLRAASIAGVVLDANGEPREGALVELRRKGWDHGWTPQHITTSGTDGDGAFRFPLLPPGSFYVSVDPGVPQREFLDERGQPIRTTEAVTWYNGSLTFAHATAIPIEAGQNIDNLVITIHRVTLRHVSGRLGPSVPPEEIGKLQLELPPVGTTHIAPNGAFQMDRVPPGRYRLRLVGGKFHTETEVDLTNGDVEGLVVEALPLLPVRVAIRLEGGGPAPDRMVLRARNLETDVMSDSRKEPDGSYSISVTAGMYRLETSSDDRVFMKAVSVNGETRPDAILDLRKGLPGAIEANLSSNLATIEGTFDRPEETPLSFAATVVLMDQSKSRSEAAGPTASVDPSGKFEFESVPPGKYRLFAIEGFEEDLWGSPELASALREKSVALDVHEGEKKSLAVPLITPAEWTTALRKAGM